MNCVSPQTFRECSIPYNGLCTEHHGTQVHSLTTAALFKFLGFNQKDTWFLNQRIHKTYSMKGSKNVLISIPRKDHLYPSVNRTIHGKEISSNMQSSILFQGGIKLLALRCGKQKSASHLDTSSCPACSISNSVPSQTPGKSSRGQCKFLGTSHWHGTPGWSFVILASAWLNWTESVSLSLCLSPSLSFLNKSSKKKISSLTQQPRG